MPSWALEMSTQRARASSLLRPPRTHEMQSTQCLERVCSSLFTVESIPLSSRHVMAAHTPSTSPSQQPPGWAAMGTRIKGELQGVHGVSILLQIIIVYNHISQWWWAPPKNSAHSYHNFQDRHWGWGWSMPDMAEIGDGIWIITPEYLVSSSTSIPSLCLWYIFSRLWAVSQKLK